MASFLRPWLAVVVLSAGASGCATLGGARGKDLVSLRYGWPEQASMRVIHTVDVRTDWSGRQTAERRFTMILGPVDAEGQRRLVVRDVEIIGAPFPAFVEPLATAIIDAQGDFQGIDPLEDRRSQAFLEALPLSPRKKAQLTASITAGLEREARDKWNQWVGSWHGARLKPGKLEVGEMTMDVGSGRKSTQSVPAEERIRLDVGVPCSDADPEPRCARLHVVREPVGQTDDTPGRFARVELELVTEPTTLLPHSARILRMDRVDWNAPDGEPDFHESVHVEQHTFIHGADTMTGPMARVMPRQPSPTLEK
ncbi:hypothetical protein D7V97_22980 [Corallococcus sp. CA053C]|uniref:hypothetical protein n=1 Tax=Corallococcus sp. CA053C TaxID=2316732 RepID=UPI000EA1295A|nr:hypothetical protein [Corallococcus sp. CA053C]RKH06136.1 hypothetical protein D7V97_22980 [Corallococcus sp. CA053C]